MLKKYTPSFLSVPLHLLTPACQCRTDVRGLFFFLFQNLLVYNWQQKQLSIGPFTYAPFDNIDNLLRMPDQFYRQVGTHIDRIWVDELKGM